MNYLSSYYTGLLRKNQKETTCFTGRKYSLCTIACTMLYYLCSLPIDKTRLSCTVNINEVLTEGRLSPLKNQNFHFAVKLSATSPLLHPPLQTNRPICKNKRMQYY